MEPAFRGLNEALKFQDCLHNLMNCSSKQLEFLQKTKHGKDIAEGSSHVLNELIYSKHWSSIVVIEILGAVGLVLCVAGFRLLKIVLFLSGLTIGFLLTYTLTPLLVKTKICCGAQGNRIVHLSVSVVVGLVLGILSLNLYRLGVFAVGQCLGLRNENNIRAIRYENVALFILCTPFHVYFDSNLIYGTFMATSCCLFGSLSCKYEKPVVIIATASGGSLTFLYGLDHFVHTSFAVAIESLSYRIKDVIFDGLHSEYSNWTYHATSLTHYKALHFQNKAIPMFVSWTVLTVLGIGIQYKWTNKNDCEQNEERFSLLNCFRGWRSFSKSDYA